MKRSETALVIGKIAAIDNRRTDDPNRRETPILDAWHELIGDLRVEDCLEAVKLHRQRTTDWLQPAHIRAIVTEIREARLRGVNHADLTEDVDPNDGAAYLATLRHRIRALGDGMPLAAVQALPLPTEAAHAALTPEKRVAAIEAARR